MIMNKPKDIPEAFFDIFFGHEVLALFYYQGIYKENHIPKELQDWIPDRDKEYKVWWHYIDSADPCDEGIMLLDYIEECDESYKKGLREKLNIKLSNMSNSKFLKICRLLDIDLMN